ncbi:hypothetical protein [Flavobacterium alvei]|uniref:hypothetical protein n=1 Tax=Flavobacterium alvei TaxID=2080416 RepID=UPI0026F01727|nr:hypothetical protein [Flavobacterium alvei]
MRFLSYFIICLIIISCKKTEKKLSNADKVNMENNTEITVKEDSKSFTLNNCKVQGENDLLDIKLNNGFDSDFELRISKIKNKFITEYTQLTSVTDSSYKKPVFNVINQSIILNKTEYKKGDIIEGKLKIDISAHHTWEKDYVDTIKVTGSFKTILE